MKRRTTIEQRRQWAEGQGEHSPLGRALRDGLDAERELAEALSEVERIKGAVEALAAKWNDRNDSDYPAARRPGWANAEDLRDALTTNPDEREGA